MSYLAAVSKMASTILRSCDSSFGLAGSWVHGNSSGSYKCHFSCSGVHKALCEAKNQSLQIPGQWQTRACFQLAIGQTLLCFPGSCLNHRHKHGKPLRVLNLLPGHLEGITSSHIVFWQFLVLTFICITFFLYFYYANILRK